MGIEYDIGDRYEQFKTAAALPRAERYTWLKMLGDVRGKKVLDLGCGPGFYTRQIKEQGATKVVGVDISQEVITEALEEEGKKPLGIEYLVSDARDLPRLDEFDVVTAVYLLTYSDKRNELRNMFHSIHRNLSPGGRFIGFTANPEFSLEKSNCTRYGLSVLKEQRLSDGCYVCDGEFHIDPPAPFQFYRWSADVYAWALAQAGFERWAWHAVEVPADELEKHGAEFWKDFHDNCLIRVLTAEK